MCDGKREGKYSLFSISPLSNEHPERILRRLIFASQTVYRLNKNKISKNLEKTEKKSFPTGYQLRGSFLSLVP